MDFEKLLPAARAKGVQLLPGTSFVTSGKRIEATRLGFASMNAAEVDLATRRLHRTITAME
jgi:DNA-binding transcriptional MocR family regulator